MTVVRDNDTELSRGFSFVTFEDDEMAGKAIKDMNRKEIKSVCPPHGRLSVKFAEKRYAWEQSEGEKKERAGEWECWCEVRACGMLE